mgnify:CR=1 FL=1
MHIDEDCLNTEGEGDQSCGVVDLSGKILKKGNFKGSNKVCSLCGNIGGLKANCEVKGCKCGFGKKFGGFGPHGRGPHYFHPTCARQAGFTALHKKDGEEIRVRCLAHSDTENNLRAQIEELVHHEYDRCKNFGNKKGMTYYEASKFLDYSIRIIRTLGWAWRWAEWWVDTGWNWEIFLPYMKDGETEEDYQDEVKKFTVYSTRESRLEDARKCRLSAFGAALRNRDYDTYDNTFRNEAFQRALKAILNTKSLVGPLDEQQVDFCVEWLTRAYRSKSRLLCLGENKIELGNRRWLFHQDDHSPKFKLGARPLPGLAAEEAIEEVDDFEFVKQGTKPLVVQKQLPGTVLKKSNGFPEKRKREPDRPLKTNKEAATEAPGKRKRGRPPKNRTATEKRRRGRSPNQGKAIITTKPAKIERGRHRKNSPLAEDTPQETDLSITAGRSKDREASGDATLKSRGEMHNADELPLKENVEENRTPMLVAKSTETFFDTTESDSDDEEQFPYGAGKQLRTCTEQTPDVGRSRHKKNGSDDDSDFIPEETPDMQGFISPRRQTRKKQGIKRLPNRVSGKNLPNGVVEEKTSEALESNSLASSRNDASCDRISEKGSSLQLAHKRKAEGSIACESDTTKSHTNKKRVISSNAAAAKTLVGISTGQDCPSNSEKGRAHSQAHANDGELEHADREGTDGPESEGEVGDSYEENGVGYDEEKVQDNRDSQKGNESEEESEDDDISYDDDAKTVQTAATGRRRRNHVEELSRAVESQKPRSHCQPLQQAKPYGQTKRRVLRNRNSSGKSVAKDLTTASVARSVATLRPKQKIALNTPSVDRRFVSRLQPTSAPRQGEPNWGIQGGHQQDVEDEHNNNNEQQHDDGQMPLDDGATLTGRNLYVKDDDAVSLLSLATRYVSKANIYDDKEVIEKAAAAYETGRPLFDRSSREWCDYFARTKMSTHFPSARAINGVPQPCVLCCKTCDDGLRTGDTKIDPDHPREARTTIQGCNECFLAAFEAKHDLKIDRNDVPEDLTKNAIFLCTEARRFADDTEDGTTGQGKSCFEIWHERKELPALFCKPVQKKEATPPFNK